jgi:hypothetical protein
LTIKPGAELVEVEASDPIPIGLPVSYGRPARRLQRLSLPRQRLLQRWLPAADGHGVGVELVAGLGCHDD